MISLRRLARPVSYLVTSGLLALGLHLPAAHAALIGTDQVVSAAQADQARGRIAAALARDDVRQALVARGVEPTDVQARIDALTDQEAQQLATQLDELPAGSGVVGALVLIFLVLLVTDILGFTDVFPFVKKTHRR